MLKNIISYIFIYIILVGCENQYYYNETECLDCLLELSTDLGVDDNDYYHLNFNHNYSQTFATIYAQVGYGYEWVGWTSDTQYCFEWNGTTQCSNVVNGSSYSGSDGIATTLLGVHVEHVGDTVTVYCGYYDGYGQQHLDSLEVIIDE